MNSNNNPTMKYYKVVQSVADHRNYRAFVLDNKMKVLLGSDPTLEKSAASISVAVGSMNDATDLPGLAHLCEHMLVIEENGNGKGYGKFISEQGGNCNAFSTRDQTNFHFDVASHAFVEAITRFSRFFALPPAFPEKVLEREISVVNSEHENKLTNDGWRKMGVEAYTAKKSHPFGQFSTGNKETLCNTPKSQGINVLQRLRDFHSKFYSSSIMGLAILAKEDLDELEALVKDLFSPVKNLGTSLTIWPENPFGPEECQKRIDIVPVSDFRDLYICFPTPDSRPYYKTIPLGYLSNLLGHKGPKSLYSGLSRRGWVNNTFLNSAEPARGFGYFAICLQLTVEGLNSIDDIINYVFQYIAMLKNAGPQKYFWDELREILGIQFRFYDSDYPIDFVQRVSNMLNIYPMADVLSVGYLFDEYDESIIKRFLDCLSPENCRIMTISKSNDTIANETEPWYGVKYCMSNIDEDLIQRWKTIDIPTDIDLPPINKFIPSDFSLKHVSNAQIPNEPRKILEDALGKVWFMQDPELNTPKAFIRLEFFSPLPMMDPITYNLNCVLSLLIKDYLCEELYGSMLAGLNYSIKGTMYGFEITVNGYDEKICCLMDTIIKGLLKFQLEPQLYQGKIDSYENGILIAENQQPYAQVPYYLSLLMREKRFTNDDLLESLSDMKPEMIDNYHKLLLSKAKLEWLIYGNILESEALEHTQNWHKLFKESGTMPLLQCQGSRLREVLLPPGSTYFYNLPVQCQSSCCAVLHQIGSRNFEENLLLELLDQIIYEPCFCQLRNAEQLGYIVRCSVRKSNGTQGLLIVVQGVTSSPEVIHERINAFLINFSEILSKMPEVEFTKHKKAVLLKKQDTPKKLTIRANRLWNNEIYSREYDFKRVKKEVDFLNKLEKIKLVEFYNKYFGDKSEDHKCIAVYMVSISSESYAQRAQPLTTDIRTKIHAQEIENVTEWKNKMRLFPLS